MNVIRLDHFKKAFEHREEVEKYKERIIQMQKAESLCELLEFHQLIKDQRLTMNSTQKGISLMEVLMERSLTPALKDLANKYHQQLSTHFNKLMTH